MCDSFILLDRYPVAFHSQKQIRNPDTEVAAPLKQPPRALFVNRYQAHNPLRWHSAQPHQLTASESNCIFLCLRYEPTACLWQPSMLPDMRRAARPPHCPPCLKRSVFPDIHLDWKRAIDCLPPPLLKRFPKYFLRLNHQLLQSCFQAGQIAQLAYFLNFRWLLQEDPWVRQSSRSAAEIRSHFGNQRTSRTLAHLQRHQIHPILLLHWLSR